MKKSLTVLDNNKKSNDVGGVTYMKAELQGSIMGVIATILLYFAPFINIISPIIGGAIGGYIVSNRIDGGIKVGALMTVIMIIPGFLISGILGIALHDTPLFGAALGSCGIILTIILIAQTALLGTIGAIIGSLVGSNVKNRT